jgi:hypothetical protein
MPLLGRHAVVTPILMAAWKTMRRTSPPASRAPKRSAAVDAMPRPATAMAAKSETVPSVPRMPSSSPTTGKTKSVWQYGR